MEQAYLTQEELQQLQSIQINHNQIIQELGKIEFDKIKLQERRDKVEEYLEELQQESQTLSEFLEHKYGKCSINTDTGEITPIG
jgi:hypothetical protein